MLRAKAKFKGRDTFIIGLSWENLDHFRAGPGDSFITIKGEEHGLPMDILIFSDRTEADMARAVAGSITKDTVVLMDDALKN